MRVKNAPAEGVQRGGYVLKQAPGSPEVILIGTGSEVHIALDAAGILADAGVGASVVSIPSWELFDAQSAEYRNSVLPPAVRARVSIEAATPLGWERYVGGEGIAVGVPSFGASAPYQTIYDNFGLTARRVADEAFKLARPGHRG